MNGTGIVVLFIVYVLVCMFLTFGLGVLYKQDGTKPVVWIAVLLVILWPITMPLSVTAMIFKAIYKLGERTVK